MHPNAFIRQLLEVSPGKVLQAVLDQQKSLLRPPVPMSDLLSLFERLDLTETAAALRRLME